MKRPHALLLHSLLALLLVLGFTGCDTLESINPFSNEKEVSGLVEAIGTNSLTVEGIEYTVTDKTKFEGDLTGLTDLSVGDEVEVEYKENGGRREALEIEKGGDDD